MWGGEATESHCVGSDGVALYDMGSDGVALYDVGSDGVALYDVGGEATESLGRGAATLSRIKRTNFVRATPSQLQRYGICACIYYAGLKTKADPPLPFGTAVKPPGLRLVFCAARTFSIIFKSRS